VPARFTSASGWHPHGLAIRDYAAGDRRAAVIAHRSDGAVYPMPARVFFRAPRAFPALERFALGECRGRVLDIGAGAGCHALALQARGLPVTALDISPAAVRVMRRRGVRDARVGDVFRFDPRADSGVDGGAGGAPDAAQDAAPYDTLLLMMNGIAIAGTLAGLRRLLRRVRRWIPADGRLLLDSMDLRRDDGFDRSALARARRRGRYFGEICYRFEYKGRIGPDFPTLFVDPRTLLREAAQAGWRGQMLFEEEDGSYLARLGPEP
jgi:SAM-dependent methyltransferase